MVPPIRIKLEIMPADGSAKPRTFPSFKEAAEYGILFISFHSILYSVKK